MYDVERPLIFVCRCIETTKWIALEYKVKDGAYMTVYPLLGKAIIWAGGMIDLTYMVGPKIIDHDFEIGIMRADGKPRKGEKNE